MMTKIIKKTYLCFLRLLLLLWSFTQQFNSMKDNRFNHNIIMLSLLLNILIISTCAIFSLKSKVIPPTCPQGSNVSLKSQDLPPTCPQGLQSPQKSPDLPPACPQGLHFSKTKSGSPASMAPWVVALSSTLHLGDGRENKTCVSFPGSCRMQRRYFC